MPTPQEDYGLKVAKVNRDASSKNRSDLAFTSAVATYMRAKAPVVTVNSDLYVVSHGLGYIPKVLVFHITTSGYNRKLPYDDGANKRDFSVTANDVKIRGAINGEVFKIYVFAQPIL